MGKIYCILGYSEAGKDTLAQEMLKLTDGVVLKWSRPMKDLFEHHYQLPTGFLDDHTLRQQKVPDHPDGITWHELMIRAFHHLPAIDPDICIRKVRQSIERSLKAGRVVILTDTRQPREAQVIKELGNFLPVWVCRPGLAPKASDCYSMEIYRQLSEACPGVVVMNNRGLAYLSQKAKDILNG